MDINSLHGHSLRKRRIVLFFAFCIAVVCVVVGYFFIRSFYYNKLEQQLVTIADDRSHAILQLVDNYRQQGELRVHDAEVIKILYQLQSVTAETINNADHQKLIKALELIFEKRRTQILFKNSIFVNNKGLVVFCDYLPDYVGKNLTQEPYKTSAIGLSYMRASMALTPDISDFAWDMVFKAPALYVSLPVFYQEKSIGILIQRVAREPIYSIVDQYIGLGKTGDTIIARKFAEGLLILNRIRHEQNAPLKKFLPITSYAQDFPLALAASGYHGVGLSNDAQQKQVEAWRYIPGLNWGLISSFALDEFKHSLMLIWFVAVILVLLLGGWLIQVSYQISWLRAGIKHIRLFGADILYSIKKRISIISLLFFIFFIVLYFFYYSTQTYFDAVKQHVVKEVKTTINAVDHALINYEKIGHQLAFDIAVGNVTPDTLQERLSALLKSNTQLYGITVASEPYLFDPKKRLYALYVFKEKDSFTTQHLEETFDYLAEKPAPKGLESETWAWYAQPIHDKKVVWFDTYKETEESPDLLGGFSIPIYKPNDTLKNSPIGVVNIVFKMDVIANMLAQLTIGKTGYSFLLSQAGTFIYYPLESYITKQKTIEELAQQINSIALLNIGAQALSGKKGFGQYYDQTMQQHVLVYYEPIPVTKWPVMFVFPKQEASLPAASLRHYYMLFLVSILALFFGVFWILTGRSVVYQYHRYVLMFLLTSALVIFFYIIRIYQDENVRSVVITDQVHLKRFLYEQEKNALYLAEPPAIQIPFGILIYEAGFSSPTTLDISGYIWQKFHKTINKDLMREPQFPQAIEKVTIKKSYEKIEGDFTVMGWQFNAKLAQNFDFKKYPFDALTIGIDIDHPDMAENILLVPDFADYNNISPTQLPGVDKTLSLPGFLFKKTFFSFYKEPGDTDLGLQSYKNTVNRYFVSFNIELERKLLYDMTVFLLPLFIIFLILYALSWIAEKEWLPIMLMSGYSGLLFATILLHRILRDRYQSADILFIEYLFFMVYLTIVPLALYILFKVYLQQQQSWLIHLFAWYRTYYWPIQFTMLLIISYIIFY